MSLVRSCIANLMRLIAGRRAPRFLVVLAAAALMSVPGPPLASMPEIAEAGDTAAPVKVAPPSAKTAPPAAEAAPKEPTVEVRGRVVLTLDSLAGIAPEDWPRLVLKPNPTVMRLSFTSNAAEIWSALKEETAPPKAARLPEPQAMIGLLLSASERCRLHEFAT